MFNINANQHDGTRSVRGADGGPLSILTALYYPKVAKWSDGSTDIDGIIAPTFKGAYRAASNAGGSTALYELFSSNTANMKLDFMYGSAGSATVLAQNDNRRFIGFPWAWSKYASLNRVGIRRYTSYSNSNTWTPLNNYGEFSKIIELDSTHFVGLWQGGSGGSGATAIEAAVFTVNADGTITEGTKVQLVTGLSSNAVRNRQCDVVLAETNKLVFAYQKDTTSNYLITRVGTISGTTITLQAESADGAGAQIRAVRLAKIDTGKVMVGFTFNTAGDLRFRVVTYDGSHNITWGTAVNQSGDSAYSLHLTEDGTDKALCVYSTNSQNSVKAIAMTVATTTITLGTAVTPLASGTYTANPTVYNDDNGDKGCLTKLTTDKFVLVATSVGGTYGTVFAVVLTLSGTTITTNTSGAVTWTDTKQTFYSSGSYYNGKGHARGFNLQSGAAFMYIGGHKESTESGMRFTRLTVSSNTLTVHSRGDHVAKDVADQSTGYTIGCIVGTKFISVNFGSWDSNNYPYNYMRYMIQNLTDTVEFYKEDTIIGSAQTLDAVGGLDFVDLASAINAPKLYFRFKLTSASSSFVEPTGFCCEVD